MKHLTEDFVFNGLQGSILHQRLGIDNHSITLVYLNSQFDGCNGSKPGITQHGSNSKILVVNDGGNQLMQLSFQYIHRDIPFRYRYWFLFRLRQRPFVHLLILVQRNTVYLHRDSRYHIRRLLFQNKPIQGFNIYLFITDDIGGNELTSSFLIKCLDSRILDARKLTDNTFHFFQFDTETTDFHLTIPTPYELNIAGRQVADYIARTINTCIFLIVRKRVGDIDFLRLFRTVQIPTADLGTGNP